MKLLFQEGEAESICLSPQSEAVCKSPEERDLHALAADNNHQLLETLLAGEMRSSLEQTDKHQQTPLNLAARLGHLQVVKVSPEKSSSSKKDVSQELDTISSVDALHIINYSSIPCFQSNNLQSTLSLPAMRFPSTSSFFFTNLKFNYCLQLVQTNITEQTTLEISHFFV